MVSPGLIGDTGEDRSRPRAHVLRGRDSEMEIIGECLSAASRGSGSVVLIDGPAGLGKSRLIEESIRVSGRLSIPVGASGNEPGSSFVPMAPLLAALFEGDVPLLDRRDIGDLSAIPEHRYWLFQEIQDLIERRGRETPMLVCIDDLQWADRGTIAALRTLAPAVAGSPVIWLLAFRRNEATLELLRAVDELGEHGARTLDLAPLAPVAVEAVVGDVLGASAGPDLLELAANAQGNPFLLIEVLLGLDEEGLLRPGEEGVELIEARLPARVRDSMRERLARMSAPARHAAIAAAVLGRGFTFTNLATMLDQAPTRMLDSVEELVSADLVVESGDTLQFRHDLIGEAVLQTIPDAARRDLDRQAVDVLLQAGALPTEIAERLAASASRGDSAAIEMLHKAARSIGPTDPGTAGELGRKALALTSLDDPRRVDLVKETALLLHLSGRANEARDFADRALADVLSPAEQAQVLLSIATMFTLTAELRVAASRDSLELSGVPDQLRALHLSVLVLNLVAAGRPRDARSTDAEALALIESTADDGASLALALSRMGLLEAEGNYEAMLAHSAAFDGVGDAPEARTIRSSSEWFRSNALAATDRLDEALELIGDGLVAARRDRQGWMVPRWELWRGRFLLQCGRLSDAQAALEGVFSAGLVVPPLPIDPDAAGLLALSKVAVHTGNAKLQRMCERMARETLAVGQQEGRRQLAWLLASQDLARDDAEAAIQSLEVPSAESQLSPLPDLGLDHCDFPQLARLAVAAGDGPLGRYAVSECERRQELNPSARNIRAAAAHTRGLLDRDISALEAAAKEFEGLQRPLALASVLEDLGAALVATNRTNEAIASLDGALKAYARSGASWDARRVRRRLRAVGVRRRVLAVERPATGWLSLTESEVEVVRLVAEGLTNREAAERLYVSPHTVSTHLRHAFAKLAVNSRVELARLVLEHDRETEAP